MNNNPYPQEVLDENSDDGTMPENVDKLTEAVVGRRIVGVDLRAEVPGVRWGARTGLELTLDNGRRVFLRDTDECCAYTELQDVVLHLPNMEHMIMGVGTTDKYETWHIFADFGDVMELKVGWSCGNPFYYGYGFDIVVVDPADGDDD